MSQIPYVDSPGYVTAEVKLRYASNVFLVDRTNLDRYNSSRGFNYYSCYYDHSPVKISVNQSGRLFLIVDNGEQYNYRFY
ncbi:DUF1883 domain-containing protein [Clostridium botulinum]|uniref:DUF1883 domain-containing protein n=1 Tax=Clostridium botulinum TaxID=1491 RepID=UPI002247605A|nr:DUF1883 domain-containing protein [Clostridium botulinum]UZP02035.1 DUF1883 domain-containing protein [Clostridium botulinum]UZP05393.1 DUF1883 domain-containing protein [Clostridium botulinum]UZP08774.1 DUF1883 domain-containing protein [Clostridium botulinum]